MYLSEARLARLRSFFETSRPMLKASHESTIFKSEFTKNLDPADFARAIGSLSRPLAQMRAAGLARNVWAIAGLKRKEVRNAAVLAALWSADLFPQTAAPFLSEFLKRLSGLDPQISNADWAAGYSVRTEESPLGDLSNRIDISIESGSVLLMIEVKIDARERPEKTGTYRRILEAKARILNKHPCLMLLGPKAAVNGDAVHATWSDVSAAARSVVRERESKAERDFGDTLLYQFAGHILHF